MSRLAARSAVTMRIPGMQLVPAQLPDIALPARLRQREHSRQPCRPRHVL